MNPADPLAELQPLRLPEPVGWWPPAPGWWLLLAALAIGIALAAAWWLRRHRAGAVRRLAARQLEAHYARFEDDRDTLAFATRVNALLKRVALESYDHRDVAARHGAAWAAFLNDTAPGPARFEPRSLEAIYAGDPGAIDPDALHRAARDWVRRHRRPS